MDDDRHVDNSCLEMVTSCLICGEQAFSPVMTIGQWHLQRCQTCGIVFTSPRYTPSALEALYRDGYYESTAMYFESQLSPPTRDHLSNARQAARYVNMRSPASIDIGTGCGRQVAAFSALGFKAKGTEPSEAACLVARQAGRDVVNVGFGELPDATYDCVTAYHVLEHVPEPLAFVRNMCRIAAAGGVVVIEVPNFESKASRKLGERWPALYPDTHLFQFTPTTLSDLCRRAGLRVMAIQRVGGGGGFATSGIPQQGERSSALVTSSALESRNVRYSRGRGSATEGMRRALLAVPGMRGFLRWVNWELLGHGEFVRVIARKPS